MRRFIFLSLLLSLLLSHPACSDESDGFAPIVSKSEFDASSSGASEYTEDGNENTPSLVSDFDEPVIELAQQGLRSRDFRLPSRTRSRGRVPGSRNRARPQPSRSSNSQQVSTRSNRTQLLASTRPPGNMMGDLLDTANLCVSVFDTRRFQFYAEGTVLSGSGASSVLAFERDGIGGPNDAFSVGAGTDVTGDGHFDSFSLLEPIPPNEIPTSPGANYAYAGGTAVYTANNSGEQPVNDQTALGRNQWFLDYAYSALTADEVKPPIGGGAAVRRVKLADNNSPMPRDRLFFDYRFFHDVIAGIGDVSRYTFGFEKTFRDGNSSIEVRFPFAATLDSEQMVSGRAARNFESGNLTLIYKDVVYASDSLLGTIGTGIAFPSADGTTVTRDQVGRILEIDNQAIHLLPYAGFLWQPNEEYYLQGFCQFDFDTAGNPVYADAAGGKLPRIGVLQESSWLFLDLSGGYWLYQSDTYDSLIQRVAAVGELHYSSTLQDADRVSGNNIDVFLPSNRLDIINTTFGFHIETKRNSTIATALGIPLRSGDDKRFEYELIVSFNSLF